MSGEYNTRRRLGVVRPARGPTKLAPPRQGALAPGQTYRPGSRTRGICARLRGGVRALPRLLPDPLGVRAHVVPDRVGGHARVGDVHARLLSSRARPVHRADDDEAIARHAEESQGAPPSRALPRPQRAPALSKGLPAAPRESVLRRGRGAEPAQAGYRRDPHLPGRARNAYQGAGPEDIARLSWPVARDRRSAD